MQIFINELSLEGQYLSGNDFTQAVKIFTGIFSLINEKVKEKQMYKDDLFINREAIRGKHFQASFQRIGDLSLRTAFREIIFNKLNPKDWRQDQKHSIEDKFMCTAWDELESVTDTTLAEAAERILQDRALVCLLVNFSNSRFRTFSSLPVLKNDNEDDLTDLDCVEDRSSLKSWLEAKLKLSQHEYDYTSKVPPVDSQTVLRDNDRFQATNKFFQGRRVYMEIETGYFWYVDNFHFGEAAHLEVFNAQTHIGEADLEGNVDSGKSDANKRLNFT
jgi:hypothetical protein